MKGVRREMSGGWGVRGHDVTWVPTSSGPLKCVYFMYICKKD